MMSDPATDDQFGAPAPDVDRQREFFGPGPARLDAKMDQSSLLWPGDDLHVGTENAAGL